MMNINFDKDRTYLLACSYGPDSMALFDILFKNKVNFVCCHVNYHKRDVSNFEEESLKKYCKDRKIVFEVLDSSKFQQNGNFQAWARDLRYHFFKQCYEKYGAAGLFVAHQQDDLLETYLIQKRRNAMVTHYGLLETSIVNGMNIIRPLLCYTKSQLENYNKKNDVPYSIDVSNLGNDYERNRIRHLIIEKLELNQRKELLNEISEKNKELEQKKINSKKIKLDVNNIKKINDEDFTFALFNILNKFGIYSLSKAKIKSLKNLAFSDKPNIIVKLSNNVFYCQEYGDIYIYEKCEPYKYVLNVPGSYSFNEFDIDFTNAEDRNIKKTDYPLTIRCFNSKDKYKIKNYYSSVNRLFIDWKMPKHLRYSWPIIENKNGEIIYIPRYRKNFTDNHKSKFMIKIK